MAFFVEAGRPTESLLGKVNFLLRYPGFVTRKQWRAARLAIPHDPAQIGAISHARVFLPASASRVLHDVLGASR
jgi:hypothetical protein